MQRRGLRAVLVLAYGVFLFSLFEPGSRAFWAIRSDVPFPHPSRTATAFYPEIAPLLSPQTRQDDTGFDVLLLGGSALNLNFGPIGQLLAERLTQASGRPVRVHNLAMPGHTALDSLYKYHQLEPARFDLVATYHGIDALRANNAPPDVFRDDYSHYGWYELVRDVVDQDAFYPFAAPTAFVSPSAAPSRDSGCAPTCRSSVRGPSGWPSAETCAAANRFEPT